VYTDHSIPRRPRSSHVVIEPADAELVPFAGFRASDRDLGLAYAIVAPRQKSDAYRARALALLQKAERESPADVEVLLYLAELYRNGGQADLAVPLYRRAMQLDPAQVTASVGLGGILMERSQFADAIPLWEDALTKNAGLELVRTNLAMAYWRVGDLASAEKHLRKALELSPAFGPAGQLLKQLLQQR
jgi:type IV pilus assembly protein PilF